MTPVDSQGDAVARSDAGWRDQPLVRVTRDGVEFWLLGTAHVSRASVDAVAGLLANEVFDAVAVELCAHRAQQLRKPDAIAEMDLWRVLREGRAGVVAAGLALGAYQRRLAEQFGIEPGAEMRVALEIAEQQGAASWLIDRDVGVTLRRARARLGWWDRAKLSAGLVAAVVSDDAIDESEIEQLKQGDVLTSTFAEFAAQSDALYESLIRERDRYMAASLRQHANDSPERPARVLAVVGAGHLDGLARHLRGSDHDAAAHLTAAQLADEVSAAETLRLLGAEPPASQWGRWFGYAFVAFIASGFAWAFMQGQHVGIEALTIWILATGTGGALGCIAARGHPLSVIAAFVASPVTPLHPALASGMVSAAVELWARKPRIGDFQALRDDIAHWRGWWRNRVARTLLVFFLTSLGTALGVYLAGFRIANRLVG